MLRSLRATEPIAEVSVRRLGSEPVRRTQELRNVEPGSAPHHFILTSCRPCWVPPWAVLVIVIVVPIADPFPGIPGHVIDAVGTPALFERPYWDQGQMVVPFLSSVI